MTKKELLENIDDVCQKYGITTTRLRIMAALLPLPCYLTEKTVEQLAEEIHSDARKTGAMCKSLAQSGLLVPRGNHNLSVIYALTEDGNAIMEEAMNGRKKEVSA